MPPSSDDDFARRLAALRSKSTADDSSSTEDALSARFAALFSRAPGAATPASADAAEATPRNVGEEDDLDFSELVDGVEREKGRGWHEVAADDRAEIDALLEEAAGFAEKTPEWLVGVGGTVEGGESGDRREWDLKDEEDDILRKVREELEWERRHGVVASGEEAESNVPTKEDGKETGGAEDDELAALAARFEALGGGGRGSGGGGGGDLGLPAVPSVAPGSALRIAPKKKMELPGVSEIDTWCCICNEDAEYRCSGCDNDIYCKDCLYEAHVGPQAGYEERRHKWAKYVRPKIINAA